MNAQYAKDEIEHFLRDAKGLRAETRKALYRAMESLDREPSKGSPCTGCKGKCSECEVLGFSMC